MALAYVEFLYIFLINAKINIVRFYNLLQLIMAGYCSNLMSRNDVKNVIQHQELEEIYMEIPLENGKDLATNTVCKLK